MGSSTARPKAMIVVGVMSGTSADGVDVAVVRVTPARTAAARDKQPLPGLKLLHHMSFPYPRAVRSAVLDAMDCGTPKQTTVAELARLNWRLGELFAGAVERTVAASGHRPVLVGLHGQTIYHQPAPAAYLGARTRATWQLGDAAPVAERLRVPVVSDFRAADLAAGGQGAPLVPMLDFRLFRSRTKNRVLLNLGGIANLAAIPAGGSIEAVQAFDTGPANMVVDALMTRLFRRNFDGEGKIAGRGEILPELLDELLRHPFFFAAPPKSCGREQFGGAFVDHLQSLAAGARKQDLVATASELTARSVRDAYASFCWPHLGQRAPLARGTELIVAGGGVRNTFLMDRLRALFGELGVKVRLADDLGLPSQAKEAAAFALLAWLSWHGLPGNVPSATGASRAVVLGRVTCG